jgi:hypothetical protein
LFFLSNRDEAALDESEGGPWLYRPGWLEIILLARGEAEAGAQNVEALVYAVVPQVEEGMIGRDSVVGINTAMKDAKSSGFQGWACGEVCAVF